MPNTQEAEEKALRMALHQARIRQKQEHTRILRVTQLNGKETKAVIWDNGKVLDPTLWPWYWRFTRWVVGGLFLALFGQKAEKTDKPPEKKPEKK